MALNRGSMRQQITKPPQKKKFLKARKGKAIKKVKKKVV